MFVASVIIDIIKQSSKLEMADLIRLQILSCVHNITVQIHGTEVNICCIRIRLGQDKGYTVKYKSLSEGVPKGKARGNSSRQGVIFERISQVKSLYGHYIILTIIRLTFTSLFSLTINLYTP